MSADQSTEDWAAEEGPGAADVPLGKPAAVAAGIAELPAPSLEGYRETTRSGLAKWLMVLLTVVVVGVLTLSGLQMAKIVDASVLSIPDLATAVFTPIVTLAGTALGFYFGAQTAAANGDSVGAGGMPAPSEKGWIRKAFSRVW
jgi:hypothetical protein